MAIDFRVRDFSYPVGIYRLKRLLDKTQWFAKDELLAYQERRLTAVLEQAVKHVPYYRRLFKELGLTAADIRHVDDLKKLPILSKDTVCNAEKDFIADNAKRYRPVIYSTSGTSGVPLRIHLDKSARILEFVYYWRHWSWAGYRLGDRFAELKTCFFLDRDNEAVSMWQPHLRGLMLNGSRLSFARAGEIAGAIRRYRPKFLKGMAATLYFLALIFKQAGITDISFKSIFSTGEMLNPRYRALMEQVFNCPVLDSYGHMEGAVAVSQCMEGGYHINSDYGLLEFEDPKPSANGTTMTGRAVGTSLYNLAMPFIRYDVGDDMEFSPETGTCPCGRTLPLVKAIHGRSEDIIVTPDGRLVTAMFVLPELIRGIRFAQFVQESPTVLRVNVITGEEWTYGERDKLSRYLAQFAGKEMVIGINQITPEDIIRDASGKIRTVISCVEPQA